MIPLSEPSRPVVVTLGLLAKGGELTVYAGAGLSKADPTGLPLAADLSPTVHARLERAIGKLPKCEPTDLCSVGDAAETLPGGLEALQRVIRDSADFETAPPNLGHEVVAFLTLEGAITLLVTNWDDCVERVPVGTARLNVVISDHDRVEAGGALLLKVHGCATRPRSILVTTAQLREPPPWARHEVQARLGSSRVVFVGIGSVAEYTKNRIEQLLADVGPESVSVVSPTIDSRWSDSDWSDLVPDLAPEHKIELTAEEFLGQLANEYARPALERLRESAVALDCSLDIVAGAESVLDVLTQVSGVALLRWSRVSAYKWRGGESVVHSDRLGEALLALAALAASRRFTFEDDDPLRLRLEDQDLILLIPSGNRPVIKIVREALRRAKTLGIRAPGAAPVLVLCSGNVGRLPEKDTVVDLMRKADPADLIDGPATVDVEFCDAHQLLVEVT